MNIVLLEPEIPHNTGAIGRTCAAAGLPLHLIRPLGFSADEKHLRRSGLDYWHDLDVRYYDSFSHFTETAGHVATVYMATTKARKSYTDVCYRPGDFIMFGKESAGIPEPLLAANTENCIRIPMTGGIRSLNLSVSAGIILYEALRQNNFTGLLQENPLWGKTLGALPPNPRKL